MDDFKIAIEKKVIRIISENFAIPEDRVKLSNSFIEDLQAEDLDLMCLLSTIRMSFFNIKDGYALSFEELNKEAQEKEVAGLSEEAYIRRFKGTPAMWMRDAIKLLGERIRTVGRLVDWIYEVISPFIQKAAIDDEKKSRWDLIGRKEEIVYITELVQEQAVKIARNLYNEGCKFLQEKRYEKALNLFDKSIFIFPGAPYFWQNRGVCLMNLGEYEEAIECFEEVTILEPRSAVADYALYNESLILCVLKRYDEALDNLELLLLGNPNDAGAWFLRGEIFGVLGNFSEAYQSFLRAVRLNPGLRYKLPPELQNLM